MKVICKGCQTEFDKAKWAVITSKSHFCTRSCAAVYNNIHRPSRLKKTCKACDKKIKSSITYCHDCRYGRKQRTTFDESQSLLYYATKSNDMNRFRGVRLLARKKTKSWLHVCKQCEYSLFVETCHIKSIADFPLDTLVSVVNADDNLVILCRNCHWELDHHFIKLGPEGFGPSI